MALLVKWENNPTVKKIENSLEVCHVCRQKVSVNTGDVFYGVHFSKKLDWPKFDFSKQKVCVLGIVYEHELLVSTKEQRYFFTLRDGWGVKDGYLYGMELGMFIDFGHSVTREEIQKIADRPFKKNGVFAHMSEAMEKERMKTILKVMDNTDKGEAYVK